MPTSAVIRNQVLQELGVIRPGQTAGSDNASAVDTKYTQWHALYAEKNAVYWAAGDDIPDEAANSVVCILADECVHMFKHVSAELSPQRRLEISARRERAEKDLRLLNNVDYQPTETYFEDY